MLRLRTTVAAAIAALIAAASTVGCAIPTRRPRKRLYRVHAADDSLAFGVDKSCKFPSCGS